MNPVAKKIIATIMLAVLALILLVLAAYITDVTTRSENVLYTKGLQITDFGRCADGDAQGTGFPF
jgi:hypothetical protein